MEIFIYITLIIILIILYLAYKGSKTTNIYLYHLYEYRKMLLKSPYMTLYLHAQVGNRPIVTKIVNNFETNHTFGVSNLSEQELQSLYTEIMNIILWHIATNTYPDNENDFNYTSEDLKRNTKFREEFQISMEIIINDLLSK